MFNLNEEILMSRYIKPVIVMHAKRRVWLCFAVLIAKKM